MEDSQNHRPISHLIQPEYSQLTADSAIFLDIFHGSSNRISESSVNKLDAHTARSWTPGATERGLQKVQQNSALAIAQREVGLPADKHMTPRQAFFCCYQISPRNWGPYVAFSNFIEQLLYDSKLPNTALGQTPH